MGISYIHTKREPSGYIYFCINYPANARATLTSRLKNNSQALHGKLVVDFLSADTSLRQWQQDIHTRRQTLIDKVSNSSQPLTR
jgi:hypothetical protein